MNMQCDQSTQRYAHYLAARSLTAQSPSTSYELIRQEHAGRTPSVPPLSGSEIDVIISTVLRSFAEATNFLRASSSKSLTDPSAGAFLQLQEMEWEQTTAILDELTKLSWSCSERLIRRLRDLFDSVREEDPNEPPVSVASLKDFANFLTTRNDWHYPDIGISPRRNISIEWYKDDDHHLAIEFYGGGDVKFAIFAPDNARTKRVARIAGSASVEGVFEAIKPFNPLSWVANVQG